ncbi:unnamed protein product [Prunus armeniaca]
MILERKRRTSASHVVLPVFYDVDPSHVRKQTGSLAKAFARHQKTQPLKKMKAWREGLAEVADLTGMVLQNQAHGEVKISAHEKKEEKTPMQPSQQKKNTLPEDIDEKPRTSEERSSTTISVYLSVLP